MSSTSLAAALAALLTPRDDWPLALALVLQRIGGRHYTPPASLCAAAERKLRLATSAGALSAQVCERLAEELCAVPSAWAQRVAQALRHPPKRRGAPRGEGRRDRSSPPATPALEARAAAERLSSSSLWSCSKAYYVQRGASAWTTGDVPCHVSCSALSALAYADVCAAFLRDHGGGGSADGSSGAGGRAALHERALIIDLGCGCGTLGVRVARRLWELGERRFTLVLADLNPAAALEQVQMPPASELVARGVLDVAAVDADAAGGFSPASPPPLQLLLSGSTIEPRSLEAPLIVLANYVLDSLPCDLFRLRPPASPSQPPQLEALHLLPTKGADAESPPAAAPFAPRCSRFAYLPVPPTDARAYFGEPMADSLLAAAVEGALDRMASNTDASPALAFVATGAARCLHSVAALRAVAPPDDGAGADAAGQGSPPALLLVGDKLIESGGAASRLAATAQRCAAPFGFSELGIFAAHGARDHRASVAVSSCLPHDSLVDAVGHVFECEVETLRSPALLEYDVSALLLVPRASAAHRPDSPATRRAFAERLGAFGPAEMERLLAFVLDEAAREDRAARIRSHRLHSRRGRRRIAAICAAPRNATGHDPADTDAAPRVSLGLLVRVIALGGFDWDEFLSLRWHMAARMASVSEDEVVAALEVGSRCFEGRVTLTRAEWDRSRLVYAQWLHATGQPASALLVLTGGGAVPSKEPAGRGRSSSSVEAEGLFLTAVCMRALALADAHRDAHGHGRGHGRGSTTQQTLDEARSLMARAAEAGHRGASRRQRHSGTL